MSEELTQPSFAITGECVSDILHAARAAASAGLNTLITRSFTRDDDFSVAFGHVQHVPGWFNATNASAFWAVMAERRPRTVVEIGSYIGRSAIYLGHALRKLGSPGSRLVSIDPHTGDRQQLQGAGLATTPTLDLFRLMVSAAGLEDMIDIRVSTSDKAAVGWSED